MSPGGDSRDAILADLQRWVQQHRGQGVPWYSDEGPPVANEQTEPATPVAATPFDLMCQKFVVDALECIAAQPPRGQQVPDTAAWPVLAAEVAACTACGLSEGRTQTVFGVGHRQADLVFIGEAPGEEEDRKGEPFVGPSGQLLTKILAAIDLARDDVYMCNILKCRPPEDRDPTAVEVGHCESFLLRQLDLLQPRVICCLGRVAAQTLLQTDLSLEELRHTVHFYRGIPVLATFHPAALLRNPAWKRDTWDDVRKLRALSEALGGAQTGSADQ